MSENETWSVTKNTAHDKQENGKLRVQNPQKSAGAFKPKSEMVFLKFLARGSKRNVHFVLVLKVISMSERSKQATFQTLTLNLRPGHRVAKNVFGVCVHLAIRVAKIKVRVFLFLATGWLRNVGVFGPLATGWLRKK